MAGERASRANTFTCFFFAWDESMLYYLKRGLRNRQNAMAQQILPDGAKVVVSYGVDGFPPWSISLWFTRNTFDAVALAALAEDIGDWFETGVLGQLSTAVKMYSVTAYDMRTVGAPMATFTPNPNPTGTKLGDPIPYQDAVVVTFRTATRGRSGRGRNYISGFTEGESVARAVSQGAADLIETAYAPVSLEGFTDGWNWVVASFQQNGQVLNPGVARPVTTSEIRTRTYGVQKGRNNRS